LGVFRQELAVSIAERDELAGKVVAASQVLQSFKQKLANLESKRLHLTGDGTSVRSLLEAKKKEKKQLQLRLHQYKESISDQQYQVNRSPARKDGTAKSTVSSLTSSRQGKDKDSADTTSTDSASVMETSLSEAATRVPDPQALALLLLFGTVSPPEVEQSAQKWNFLWNQKPEFAAATLGFQVVSAQPVSTFHPQEVWGQQVGPDLVEWLRAHKNVSSLLTEGLPLKLRQICWPHFLGHALPTLCFTTGLYEQILSRSFSGTVLDAPVALSKLKLDNLEATITADVARVFSWPSITTAMEVVPTTQRAALQQSALDLLHVVFMWRPDIRYPSGIAGIAVIFCIIMERREDRAHILLSILLREPWNSFVVKKSASIQNWSSLIYTCAQNTLPDVAQVLAPDVGVDAMSFFPEWTLTGFTRVMSLREAVKVWDRILVVGPSQIIVACLAIVRLLRFESGNWGSSQAFRTFCPTIQAADLMHAIWQDESFQNKCTNALHTTGFSPVWL
jgi:hypothetical protein